MNPDDEAPIHEVEIASVAHGGDGVCRVDGQVCFVPYALPGDRLRIAVRAKSKGILRAVIDEVIEPSSARGEADCVGGLERAEGIMSRYVVLLRFTEKGVAKSED